MAKISTASRNKLPSKTFGEPSKRAYPMPNKSHAANAKARAKAAGRPYPNLVDNAAAKKTNKKGK